MASNHTRNVSGMLNAPRCEATTLSGSRCGNPAISGKKRCKNHGGKGSKTKSHSTKFGDYSKASLERDKLTNAQIKKLDKLARRLDRGETIDDLAAKLAAISRALLKTTQNKQADLTAAHSLSPIIPKAQRGSLELVSYNIHDPAAHRTPEMIRDRARGAMLGLAVGEAVGITSDDFARGTHRELTDMVGGGKLGLKLGQWASDTAMALALMDSLSFRHGLDETDLMERFTEWAAEGVYSCTGACVGISHTTEQALARYEESSDPVAGSPNPGDVDNASLVRVAPVAIRYWNKPAALLDVAKRQSRTTHAAPHALEACATFAQVLADGIGGSLRDEVLSGRILPHDAWSELIITGSWKNKPRDEIRSGNNVIYSLEAAMWCVDQTATFEEAVLCAANLGEDAGTTAAMTGQLAGALYGAAAIPEHWLESLAWRERIDAKVDALFKQSQRSS